GQLGNFIRVDLDATSTIGEIRAFWSQLGEAHLPSLVVGVAVLVLLFAGSWKFPRAPIPLLVILAAALAVRVLDLGGNGLVLVGEVPAGLPVPRLPSISFGDIGTMILPALGVTMVAFADNVVEGRAFATRGRYSFDTNQELLALGGANLAAGLAQGFPVSSSGSRTVTGGSLGAQSQLYALVAGAGVARALLFFRPVRAS